MSDLPLAKVTIMGSPRCGKTSLSKKFIYGTYNQQYRETIGVDFYLKKGTEVIMQLWDIAGKEAGLSLSALYLKGTHLVIMVYDMSDSSSLESMVQCYLNCPSMVRKLPVVIFGTKSDEKSVTDDEVQIAAKRMLPDKDIPTYTMSAKTGEGLSSSFEAVSEILKGLNLSPTPVKAERESDWNFKVIIPAAAILLFGGMYLFAK